MSWSALCDCGISISYSFFAVHFCPVCIGIRCFNGITLAFHSRLHEPLLLEVPAQSRQEQEQTLQILFKLLKEPLSCLMELRCTCTCVVVLRFANCEHIYRAIDMPREVRISISFISLNIHAHVFCKRST